MGKSRLLATTADGAASLDALMRSEPFSRDRGFFLKLHPDVAKRLLERAFEAPLANSR